MLFVYRQGKITQQYFRSGFGERYKFWIKSFVSAVAKNKLASVGLSGDSIATRW